MDAGYSESRQHDTVIPTWRGIWWINLQQVLLVSLTTSQTLSKFSFSVAY